MPPMTEDDLTDEVVERLSSTPDPRLAEVLRSLVRHLHAFVRDVRLTDDEWAAGVRFLTETGQTCDDVRQEVVLLSDVLGVSSLVDLVNHAGGRSERDTHAGPEPTETTILGPFYLAGAPEREFGASMVEEGGEGRPALLRGSVGSTSGVPIIGATLDVWQSAPSGRYAVQEPEVQGPANLRGIYRTDDRGRYELRTVRPTPYPVPHDGPVGRLLDATGRHPWRAAHIHVKVSAPGFEPLTTHVFDRGSDYLDSDAVFGVKESLLEDFVEDADGTLVCEHDFVLRPARG
ncbi:MAG: hydroxyquinol 1,2-dioxygenase [Nocardioidaceae bacterium]|nr:hydroxyquinol 1,2-dioxygenase [Nocardioidaceae bacterium]